MRWTQLLHVTLLLVQTGCPRNLRKHDLVLRYSIITYAFTGRIVNSICDGRGGARDSNLADTARTE